MKRPQIAFIKNRRGVAAVEFAIIAPFLVWVLGGIADYGLAMVGKSQLANGVAQGMHYALLQGPSASGAVVKTLVSSGANQAGLSGTVNVTVTGPACYCTSGTPAKLVTPSVPLSATFTCTGTCPSNSPGAFMIISANYTYKPLVPMYSKLTSLTFTETVTARLK